jgi:hypothetical protein
MKATTILISVIATLALATTEARAQDDDDDLFGDGDDDDAPPPDDFGGEDLGGDTGGDTGAAATTGGEVTAEVGGPGDHPVGIGFTTTVGGLQTFGAGGVGVEYWLSNTLAITGLGRLLFFSPDEGDSQLALQVGAGAMFVLKQNGPAMLLLGGRFLLGFTSGDAGTTSVAIEGPLRLQMKLADRLSAHVEGGLSIGIGDQAALDLLGGGGESFTLLIGSRNLFGSVGMTAYF